MIEETLQPNEGFQIGGTTSKTLDLTILNTDSYVYTNQPIKVEIGLNLGSTIEYIPLGIFNIDEVEKTDYTVKFTCYDNMIKFEKPYFSNLGDNATLTQIVNEICTKVGVQFTGALPDYTLKKLEGYTCREVLSYIASLCGGNAIIDRTGKLKIVTLSEANYSITADNYFELKREDSKYKISKLACQVGEEVLEKGSLTSDGRELQFENPWVSTSILNDIYNKLNGLEYLGYSMNWQGDLSLDLGDLVTTTDVKGIVRKVPILYQKFNFSGGLTSEISAKGETQNQNSFFSSGSTSKKVERIATELAIVNKALVDVAHIGDLTAINIKFDVGQGGTLNLQTLLSNFITGNSGQFLNLTGANTVFANAIIKDAMIENVSLNKLKAGTIDTNTINLVSADGGLSIVGPTMQFKDKNNLVRLQLGQDSEGNFNFILRGTDGTTTLIDHTGIKEKAIADKLIKSNMVSDGAIGETQINYSSLITGLNKDTNTQLIKASKVAIDLEGQTLEVAFNSLKTNVNNIKVGGRNLVIRTGELKDSYLSANDTISSGSIGYSVMEGYIPVTPGETLCFTKTVRTLGSDGSSYWRWNWYDVNKVFIGRKPDASNDFQWVVPTNVYYIRVSYCSDADVKVERGNKATDWTPAPEDIEEKIQANTTQLNVAQGNINTLISDNSINKGNITTLTNNYSSLNQTVSGISSTVASHTTSISTINTNVANANALADSKAKVFTSTPVTPYKIGDIWTGGPSGELMRCKVARATGSYVASDWEKASKYTDDTKVNAVEGSLNTLSGTVTTVQNKQITLEQNLDGFKTTVSSTYATKTDLTTTNGNISSLTTRMATAESKITDSAIISTVSTTINNAKTEAINSSNSSTDNKLKGYSTTDQMNSAIEQKADSITTTVSQTYATKDELGTETTRINAVENKITATALTTTISSALAGSNSISNTKFTMDKNGLTIKNGGLKIQNNAGTTVLSADSNGNLIVTASITASAITGGTISGTKLTGVDVTSKSFTAEQEIKLNAGAYSPQITFNNYPNGVSGASLTAMGHIYVNSSGDMFLQSYNNNRNIYVEGNLQVDNASVIASGSNANGRYVRMYDGTQICYMTFANYSVAVTNPLGSLFYLNETFTFPASFVNIPAVAIEFNANAGIWVSGRHTLSMTNCGVRFFSPTSITYAGTLTIKAIGRWK